MRKKLWVLWLELGTALYKLKLRLKNFRINYKKHGFFVNCFLMTVVIVLINTFIATIGKIKDNSMEPAFKNGNNIIIMKTPYFKNEPDYWEVIAFTNPDNAWTTTVSRICGKSGDIIDIKDGAFYLNGSRMIEDYIKEPMKIEGDLHFKVPDGAYFCMGDNRNSSVDSRYWKNPYVYRDKIIGRVDYTLYSDLLQ
jgi:signal peptidase I